jgi:hypothetical protein
MCEETELWGSTQRRTFCERVDGKVQFCEENKEDFRRDLRQFGKRK